MTANPASDNAGPSCSARIELTAKSWLNERRAHVMNNLDPTSRKAQRTRRFYGSESAAAARDGTRSIKSSPTLKRLEGDSKP